MSISARVVLSAPTSDAARTSGLLRGVSAWNERRPVAEVGTARGVLWMCFIAVEFYLMSNPIVFEPWFHFSLQQAAVIATVFLIFQAPRLRLILPRPSVLLFLGFTALSLRWSQSPDTTMYTVQIYLMMSVIAWFIAVNASARVIAYGLLLGGVVIVVLSLYALQQDLWMAGVADGVGYMAGVGTNRNILAYTLAPLCAVLALPPRTRAGKVWWAGGLLVVVTGIWLAGSATGFLATAFTLAAVGYFAGIDRVRAHGSSLRLNVMRAAVLVVALIGVLNMDAIAGALGRESTTFSGRVPIWEAVWTASQPHLWIGYGWGSVWQHPWQTAPFSHPMDVIFFNSGNPTYWPPHGHNSFFDLLPQIGLLGVGCAVLVHLEAVVRACLARRGVHRTSVNAATGRMVLAMLVGLVIFGMSEPLTTIPLGWFLLVILVSVSYQSTGDHGKRRHRSAGALGARRAGS